MPHATDYTLRRGIHYDSTRFPNPRAFDPTRYATCHLTAAEAALASDYTQRDHYLFGAGRRVCQGMHIAERSLFLAISRLLWAFDFEMAVDEEGKKIVPDADELQEGVFVQPKRFPARVAVRSEERAEAVRKGWQEMEGQLDERGQWKKVPKGTFGVRE